MQKSKNSQRAFINRKRGLDIMLEIVIKSNVCMDVALDCFKKNRLSESRINIEKAIKLQQKVMMSKSVQPIIITMAKQKIAMAKNLLGLIKYTSLK